MLQSCDIRVFGNGKPPRPGTLVVWDGFDELDKEGAVAFYERKTWPDVLRYLRELKSRPEIGAAFQLEEWAVLAPDSLAYYARAHLEYLLETWGSAEPNEEFALILMTQLNQVTVMHKGCPLGRREKEALACVARALAREAAEQGRHAYEPGDIEEEAASFLAGLDADEA